MRSKSGLSFFGLFGMQGTGSFLWLPIVIWADSWIWSSTTARLQESQKCCYWSLTLGFFVITSCYFVFHSLLWWLIVLLQSATECGQTHISSKASNFHSFVVIAFLMYSFMIFNNISIFSIKRTKKKKKKNKKCRQHHKINITKWIF